MHKRSLTRVCKGAVLTLVRSALDPAVQRRVLRPTAKVLPEHARAHNRSLLLQVLFRAGPHSRADLARASGLTRVTVSDLIGDLLQERLVVELGTRNETRVGKPATLVGLDQDAALIVSLDLSSDRGPTGALVDLSGAVQTRQSRRWDGRSRERALEPLLDFARDLIGAATKPILGVGVGTPGVVDPDGVVLDAPNLGWSHFPLAAKLSDGLSLPVHVANDANAAALAEHSFGGAGDSALLAVTIGQGVGAGLLLDGALVSGDRHAAGEIGHVVVDERGPQCACGLVGCLETALAVPLLRERLEGRSPAETRRLLAAAGRRLGIALAPVVSTLNLGEVVLNGPPDLFDGPLLQAAERTVRQRTLPLIAEHLEMRLSALGADAVLLGAAVLVLSGQLGVA
jgi:predicted NBD/HSP70 family sugar kinase